MFVLLFCQVPHCHFTEIHSEPSLRLVLGAGKLQNAEVCDQNQVYTQGITVVEILMFWNLDHDVAFLESITRDFYKPEVKVMAASYTAESPR